MKLSAWITLGAVWTAGCGNNDILQMASANYGPMKVGSSWNYTSPAGLPAYTTTVLSGASVGSSGSVWNYSVLNYAGIAGVSSILESGSAIQILGSPTVLDRVLPYVTGNSWNVVTTTANVTQKRSVDGTENVGTPAGTFVRCFRLKTEIDTNLTATGGTFVWVAPNVGDVQYATIDSAGTTRTTYQLSSYSLVN